MTFVSNRKKEGYTIIPSVNFSEFNLNEASSTHTYYVTCPFGHFFKALINNEIATFGETSRIFISNDLIFPKELLNKTPFTLKDSIDKADVVVVDKENLNIQCNNCVIFRYDNDKIDIIPHYMLRTKEIDYFYELDDETVIKILQKTFNNVELLFNGYVCTTNDRSQAEFIENVIDGTNTHYIDVVSFNRQIDKYLEELTVENSFNIMDLLLSKTTKHLGLLALSTLNKTKYKECIQFMLFISNTKHLIESTTNPLLHNLNECVSFKAPGFSKLGLLFKPSVNDTERIIIKELIKKYINYIGETFTLKEINNFINVLNLNLTFKLTICNI